MKTRVHASEFLTHSLGLLLGCVKERRACRFVQRLWSGMSIGREGMDYIQRQRVLVVGFVFMHM
jgi:hypothetical protein